MTRFKEVVMYFQIEGEKITAISPSKENLSGDIVQGELPQGFDDEEHTLHMLKWNGKKVVWKAKSDLEAIKAERTKQEKRAEFIAKTGLTPEAFGVIEKVGKFIQGEMLTSADKKAISSFINKHKTIYEEVVE